MEFQIQSSAFLNWLVFTNYLQFRITWDNLDLFTGGRSKHKVHNEIMTWNSSNWEIVGHMRTPRYNHAINSIL